MMAWLSIILFFLFVILVPGYLTGILLFKREGRLIGSALGVTCVLFILPVLLFTVAMLFETNINRVLISIVAGVVVIAELSILYLKRKNGDRHFHIGS